MKEVNIYGEIFKRKSIRKYKQDAFNAETIAQIEDYINNIQPIFPEAKVEYKVITGDQIKGLIPFTCPKAPYAIAAIGKQDKKSLLNVGYVLEFVDLFFSGNDIGSLWAGSAKLRKKDDDPNNSLLMVKLFGIANEPLHRTGLSQFKRKGIRDISDILDIDEFLNYVRYAPSAMNSQNYFLKGNKNEFDISRLPVGALKEKMYANMNTIDVGIVCAFIKVISDHQGYSVSFFIDKQKENDNHYLISVKLGA